MILDKVKCQYKKVIKEDRMECLNMADAIQQLGIEYHFEGEIEEASEVAFDIELRSL